MSYVPHLYWDKGRYCQEFTFLMMLCFPTFNDAIFLRSQNNINLLEKLCSRCILMIFLVTNWNKLKIAVIHLKFKQYHNTKAKQHFHIHIFGWREAIKFGFVIISRKLARGVNENLSHIITALSAQKCIFGPKTAKFGPNLAFLAKYWSFC